jgi:hypothetical protein
MQWWGVVHAFTIPPPGIVVGGSLGNATLKHRQYPRIKEYQVLSRVLIGQRPLIRPVQPWCYKYRDRQLCRGGIVRRSRHKVTGLQGLTAKSLLKYQILGVHARYKAL